MDVESTRTSIVSVISMMNIATDRTSLTFLRPNDNKRRFGEIGFNNMVQAVEDSLTADMELYEYYYDMKKHEHDFHDYATWKVWGRKVGIK